MNKKFLTIGIALLMVAIVTATAAYFLFPYQPDQPPQTDDTDSSQTGIQQVVEANNKFAFDFYSEINKEEESNIFYSPYSISAALAMTYEGAKGQTADEMKSVFHFPESNILRPNFAAIYNNINKKDKEYKLSTGNALWAQQDYPFLEDYTNRVEQYYGGKAANVDFKQETEKSRRTINKFIEKQTNNKIKELLPKSPPVIKPATRLVLTNAIYFKGTWEWEFDKKKTREGDFKVTPTQSVKTQMMTLTGEKAKFNYAKTENLQILEMPYKGEELSMLVLLPREGTLDEFEQSLTLEKLNEWRNSLQKRKIDVYMPKFEFDTKYFMKDTLSAMGMPTAFGNADFSGMDGTQDLLIQNVIHQAFVEVNEEGTEAAAATAVVVGIESVGPRIPIFRADHPFIFIIQERETGNILFMGRVTDPTQ
ncbi:MAG: hypothetical protein MAG795_00897 [Candidatus Woesearchaeota archaeon]|nr:hypothetical protein [Candidatus Woesearchaeota archaeon]